MEEVVNGAAGVWHERIVAQRASGQSIRGWCRENGQHEHAFYWWRSRLGLSPRAARTRSRGRPAEVMEFAEAVVEGAASESIRLRLGGGRELFLPASMPVEWIARLVRGIEGAA
jgi:hypothetical protein